MTKLNELSFICAKSFFFCKSKDVLTEIRSILVLYFQNSKRSYGFLNKIRES